jgi:hypothetical protein
VAPSNDLYTNPIIIGSLPFSNVQDTTGATYEDEPTAANMGATVWYSFTSSVDTGVEVDTYNSNFDTVLCVWTYDGSEWTQIRYNDDGPDHNDYPQRFGAWLVFNAHANQTYLIQCGGYRGETGSLDIRVSAAGWVEVIENVHVFSMADWSYTTVEGRQLEWTEEELWHWVDWEEVPAAAATIGYNLSGLDFNTGIDSTPGDGYDFRYIEAYRPVPNEPGTEIILVWHVRALSWQTDTVVDLNNLDNQFIRVKRRGRGGVGKNSANVFYGERREWGYSPDPAYEAISEFEAARNDAAEGKYNWPSWPSSSSYYEFLPHEGIQYPVPISGWFSGALDLGLRAYHDWGWLYLLPQWRESYANAQTAIFLLWNPELHRWAGDQTFQRSLIPAEDRNALIEAELGLDPGEGEAYWANKSWSINWDVEADPEIISIEVKADTIATSGTKIPHEVRFYKTSPSDYPDLTLYGATNPNTISPAGGDWAAFDPPHAGVEVGSFSSNTNASGTDNVVRTFVIDGSQVELVKDHIGYHIALAGLADTQQNPSMVTYQGQGVASNGTSTFYPRYGTWTVRIPPWQPEVLIMVPSYGGEAPPPRRRIPILRLIQRDDVLG